MKKTLFKSSLKILAFPLMSALAFSGNVLCTDLESEKATSISPEEAEMQAEREVGRLWLIAMPHLTPEEKNSVTHYLQLGIQRDFDYEKSLQEAREKINNTTLNDSVDRSEDVPPTTQKEKK
ncbi:MAG: hypothetical protein O3C54_01770 [Proteobacteria bacterium]|nr:hypothetical protein [Pseudomonadota bacterium]